MINIKNNNGRYEIKKFDEKNLEGIVNDIELNNENLLKLYSEEECEKILNKYYQDLKNDKKINSVLRPLNKEIYFNGKKYWGVLEEKIKRKIKWKFLKYLGISAIILASLGASYIYNNANNIYYKINRIYNDIKLDKEQRKKEIKILNDFLNKLYFKEKIKKPNINLLRSDIDIKKELQVITKNGFDHYRIENRKFKIKSLKDVVNKEISMISLKTNQFYRKKRKIRTKFLVKNKLKSGLIIGYQFDKFGHNLEILCSHKLPLKIYTNNIEKKVKVPLNFPLSFNHYGFYYKYNFSTISNNKEIYNKRGLYYNINVYSSINNTWFIDGKKIENKDHDLKCSLDKGKHTIICKKGKYYKKWNIDAIDLKHKLSINKLKYNKEISINSINLDLNFKKGVTINSYVEVDIYFNDKKIIQDKNKVIESFIKHYHVDNKKLQYEIIRRTYNIKIPKSKTYEIKVVVDPNNKIDEINEKNNIKIIKIKN